jgi:lysylphosphatidylglycerol synthetase-like protein (DUF2156 family)
MMNFLKNFALFWWDFIVGDDWVIAAGVVIALLVTVGLERQNINAWWVMPVAVVVTLVLSLRRETRKVK